MTRWSLLAVMALAAVDSAAWAQTHQHYAGQQARAIKALSEQQIADLRAGRGMGLALAAELNGYPGPVHVLELADALSLSAEQLTTMQALVAAMHRETIPLGEQLITAETELDQQFADKIVDDVSLEAALRAIGELSASLRAAHLRYHLATVKALMPAQIEKYNELRGYASSAPAKHH